MKIGFGWQCLLALFFGAIFGLYASNDFVKLVEPLGSAFLQLLRMLVIPLTFSLIVSSLGRLNSISQIKTMGSHTFAWFVFTAVIASIIGLTIGSLFNFTEANQTTMVQSIREVATLSSIFLDMVPGNLVGQIADEKIIPLLIFAILFGVALALVKDEAKVVVEFFNGMAEVMFKITRWIIRLSPIGIFALLAQVTNDYGIESLLPFLKFIASIYLACIIHLIFYGLLIWIVVQVNPLRFFQTIWQMMIVAFTTSSSLATLPVTTETLTQKVKIPKNIVSFVAPLGSAMKMDGCGAIYSAIVAVFTAAIFGITLSWQDYLIITIVATIATIGTAGVPGTASVMAIVVLSSVGLPYAALAMVIGVDKLVDMIRTMINVTGTGVCSTLIATTIDNKNKLQIQQAIASHKNK